MKPTRWQLTAIMAPVLAMLAITLVPVRASVLAPPADFKAFTKTADVIVVGTFNGTKERPWTKDRYPKTLTDLQFTVSDVVKRDGRMASDGSIVATTDSPEELTKEWRTGQKYVLFLKWEPHFEVYVLSYGLSGAYRLTGEEAIPMQPDTDLVKKHGPLSRHQLVSLAKSALQ